MPSRWSQSGTARLASISCGRGPRDRQGQRGCDLSGGVEVDLDVAWPSRLAELRIPSRDGTLAEPTRTVVDRLLGRRRLMRLGVGRRSEPWSIGTGERSSGPGLPGGGRGVRDAIAKHGTGARQIGHDGRKSELRRAVALLEAASWAERGGSGVGLRRLRVADAHLGAELLFSSIDDLHLDDYAAHDFAVVLRRAATAARDERTRQPDCSRSAHDLDAGQYHEREHRAVADAIRLAPAMRVAAAAAPGTRRVRLARESEVNVDRRTLPLLFEHTDLRARRISASEIDVRLAGEPARGVGCWARAFDRDGTLLALSPLRAHGRTPTRYCSSRPITSTTSPSM